MVRLMLERRVLLRGALCVLLVVSNVGLAGEPAHERVDERAFEHAAEEACDAFLTAAVERRWSDALHYVDPTRLEEFEQLQRKVGEAWYEAADEIGLYAVEDPTESPGSPEVADWFLIQTIMHNAALDPHGTQASGPTRHAVVGSVADGERVHVVVLQETGPEDAPTRLWRTLLMVKGRGGWYVSLDPAIDEQLALGEMAEEIVEDARSEERP